MADQPPPHDYVPAGPLEKPSFMGFRSGEIRKEAFAAVLADVPLGAWDRSMIAHTIDMADDNELRWLMSLLWRARLTGRAEALPEGTVTEWGVRFDRHEDGRSFTDAYQGEVLARTSALNPDPDLANHGWTGTVVRRQVGPWHDVPETAPGEDEDHG